MVKHIFIFSLQIDMNVYSVWRFMLEENEKLSRARLATVQMIQVQQQQQQQQQQQLQHLPQNYKLLLVVNVKLLRIVLLFHRNYFSWQTICCRFGENPLES